MGSIVILARYKFHFIRIWFKFQVIIYPFLFSDMIKLLYLQDKKKYEEEDIDHSSDFMTDQEDDGRVSAAYHQEPEEDVDAIEFVLDHRKGIEVAGTSKLFN